MIPHPLIDRLSRRGLLTVTARGGGIEVRLEPQQLGHRTVDVADVQERERLFAKPYRGQGTDLEALLVECEEASRPPFHDVDAIVWMFQNRRATRVCGPPLPYWSTWQGWRPGQERWLRCSDHSREWLGHYRQDVWLDAENRWRTQQSIERAAAREAARRTVSL